MERDVHLVSIVIPMRNAEGYIAKTLGSILREIDVPIEVVVVNDKSTDASLTRVLAFSDKRIRVVDGPGRGAPAAMNAGLAEARGAVIMRCDAPLRTSQRKALNTSRSACSYCPLSRRHRVK